jgi:DNA repair protein RecN (Recombination protein N)
MLERLHIRDLALVDRAEVVFSPGLNVLTGETGAGKTLLVQSVSLLVGERADADAVREGATAAVVEGEFRLEGPIRDRVRAILVEWGQDLDGDALIVRREVQAGGRSRAWVNQSAVTQQALRRLGDVLADLHGQHAHQSLLRAEAGLETLDDLAGIADERGRFERALGAWREAEAARAGLERQLAHFSERQGYLADASRELRETELREGEEEELKAEAARLRHADRLRELSERALERLSESDASAAQALGDAAHALDQAAAIDPTLADLLPTLAEARIAATETARQLSRYASGLDADPGALEAIEERRERIARLTRKYKRDVPALIAWRAEIAAELETGLDGDAALARARDAERAAKDACLAAGRTLSRKRRHAAGEWTARLTSELKPLGLTKARLEFDVRARETGDAVPAPGGLDDVGILFTANSGESARPLQKVASGGELSRIMLALKTVLETQDPVDLLIFDEVDSGIGGAVAQAVGERLRRLSRHRQLICVTHLPMIAALAGHHVRVTKRAAGGRTVVRFEIVEGEERVDELSRMLAGDRVTETTRRQARELLGAGAPGLAPR